MDIFSGKSPKYEKVPTEYRIIGQAANQQNGIDYTNIKYTNLEFWQSMPEKYFLKKNDVLLNTLGNGTLGRSGIIKDIPYDLLTDGHLFVFRNLNEVISIYFYYYLQIKKEEIIKSANGSTNQTFLNLKNTLEWIIPIPPLNEQFRIIEKLEELQPFVESYTNSEEKLDNLNSSFPETLKKSILQQAVMGKLVPQDENDEPASVLLERIRAEKQRLITEGKIKKNKNESVIFRRDNSHYEKLNGIERCIDDEIPFEIPDSWEWVRLGDISTYAHTKKKINAQDAPKDMWGLDLEDIEKGGKILSVKSVGERSAKGDKTFFQKGDILYSKLRPYLLKTLVAPNDGICTSEIVPFSLYGNVDSEFTVAYLKSPFVDNLINSITYGVKMPRVGTETMTSLLVPLPPVSEQHRIVTGIEQLLPFCEQL